MVMLKIRGDHPHAATGLVYKYRAYFEGYGPDIFFKAKINVPEREKILSVERVITVDLEKDNAVDAVHAAMKKIIDETEFATVDCD
jgi:hypothetical protein